jgi:hypothetical protein
MRSRTKTQQQTHSHQQLRPIYNKQQPQASVKDQDKEQEE